VDFQRGGRKCTAGKFKLEGDGGDRKRLGGSGGWLSGKSLQTGGWETSLGDGGAQTPRARRIALGKNFVRKKGGTKMGGVGEKEFGERLSCAWTNTVSGWVHTQKPQDVRGREEGRHL